MVVIGHEVSGWENNQVIHISQEPGLSELQSHESAQSRLQKLNPKGMFIARKLGKSRPHPHEHGIFPVESRCHYAQTGYPPGH